MKIEIYGPEVEPEHLAALLAQVPKDAQHVLIQAPLRRALDLKACQRPNTLEYVASVDNKTFIFYSHHPVNGVTVKVT
jgi:hypothetical protein